MSHLETPHDPTLENYRKLSTFDAEELKNFIFSENSVKLQKDLYEEIQKYSVLYPRDGSHASVEEQKHLLVKKSFAAQSVKKKFRDLITKPFFTVSSIKVIDQLDKSIAVQGGVLFNMFPRSILYLGTEQHLQFYEESTKGKILGCFCLTEVGHGSDTKQIQTTATYDSRTKEFVIHTPSFQAAKCWIANIGKIATHAIVYAQLITSDCKRHGLHAFVVPVRDPKTQLPYPGVILADLGEKLGLLGVDNGLLLFNHYRIPKMNLLNKLGDVTDDGRYILKVTDINQQNAISFKILSQGRLSIIVGSCMFQIHALTIALRHAAVRKQFGPKDAEELPILEYQSHQYRLIPYLGCTYTTLLFLKYFLLHKNILAVEDNDTMVELHAILSAGKPYFSFIARDSIQDCREACAGLGYLSVSGLGVIRNDHDANLTFEGDNNVLLQQTSNWLLKYWPLVISKKVVKSPLGSLDFLKNALDILQLKFEVVPLEEFYSLRNICKYYQWLVCYLLKRSYEKVEYLEKTSNAHKFWIKNKSQIYNLRNLSMAYLESFVLQETSLLVETSANTSINKVLNQLVSLYAVWSLQKHVSLFYEGQYTDSPLFPKLIEDSILLLCHRLKNEVVSLVDVIAPFDDIVRSILGHSDGQIYSRLFGAIIQVPEAFSNATWLKDLHSKL